MQMTGERFDPTISAWRAREHHRCHIDRVKTLLNVNNKSIIPGDAYREISHLEIPRSLAGLACTDHQPSNPILQTCSKQTRTQTRKTTHKKQAKRIEKRLRQDHV